MPVGSLLLFGGETLKDFAFALLVGEASGAYSSIFIARPVLVEWKEREPVYTRRRKLVREEHGGLARRGRRCEPVRASTAPSAAAGESAGRRERRGRRARRLRLRARPRPFA